MRTFYIALIFIGCLSLALGAQAPFAPVTKAAAKSCTTGTGTVDGCAECQGAAAPYTCKTAAVGYYIDGTTNQAKNCPVACTECKADATAANPPICTKCQATLGFIEYVDTNPTVSGCILCKDGFTFDNGNTNALQATSQNGQCIGINAEATYSCVTGYYWNSLPNKDRKCVAKTTGSCADGYSVDGTIIKNITANCDKCATGNSIVLSQAKNANDVYYYSSVCLATKTAPTRAVPVQCTGTTATTGCKTCTAANTCAEALPGYYLEPTPARLRNMASNDGAGTTGKVLACPLSCATCSGTDKCLTCPDGAPVSATGVCDCSAAGYTTSILKSQATGPSVAYSCVSQAQGDVCSTGFVWNSEAVAMKAASICIDIYSETDNKCFEDKDTQTTTAPMTNYWNSPPNPMRKCVLATSKTCLNSYAQAQGDKSSTYETNLIGNCVACTGSATLNKQTANNQVCDAPSSSSILAMSIAFLGLLLALVF